MYWQNYKGTNGTTYDTNWNTTYDYTETFDWAINSGNPEPTWNNTSKLYTYPTWKSAIDYPVFKYCDNLYLDGYTDWRLPTKDELLSIVDTTRTNPAINITFFAAVSDGYRSSTNDDTSIHNAWVVYFFLGDTHTNSKFYNGYVRCVRKD